MISTENKKMHDAANMQHHKKEISPPYNSMYRRKTIDWQDLVDSLVKENASLTSQSEELRDLQSLDCAWLEKEKEGLLRSAEVIMHAPLRGSNHAQPYSTSRRQHCADSSPRLTSSSAMLWNLCELRIRRGRPRKISLKKS